MYIGTQESEKDETEVEQRDNKEENVVNEAEASTVTKKPTQNEK